MTEPSTGGQEPTGGTTGQEPGGANESTVDDATRLRREAANYRTQLRKAEQELAALKQAAMTDQEKAVTVAREEGAAKYRTMWKQQMVTNQALGLLAEKHVTAPDLVLSSLSLKDIDVDDEGKFDRDALVAAIDDVIRRHPFLVQAPTSATAQAPPPARGDGQQRISREAILGASDPASIDAALRYALGRQAR